MTAKTTPPKDADGELRGICAQLIATYREPVKGLAPKPLTIEDAVTELQSLIQTEKAKAVLEGKHAAYMDIVTKAGNGATVRDYATHMAAEYNKALTQQGPTNAK